jgi:tetratricopeptide (TPR) repeat protein
MKCPRPNTSDKCLEDLEISTEKAVLTRIAHGLRIRDLDDLKGALESARALLRSTSIDFSPEFLDYVARCIDLDWGLVEPVEKVFSRFPTPSDPTLRDRVHLDIVTGLLDFHRSHYDEAFRSFQDAAAIASRTADKELSSMCLYYLARSAWKRTQYSEGLRHAAAAREMADAAGLPTRVALVQMLEGWLQFLLGDFEAADTLIESARQTMEGSRDHVTTGDVSSYKGRRARQRGDFEEARKQFQSAILAYDTFDPDYRNVARCHQNIAYVHCLQIRQALDKETRENRRGLYRMSEDLQAKALRHSKEAERIYGLFPERTRRGRAKLLNDRALLYALNSNLRRSAELAEAAYNLASGKDEADGGSGSRLRPRDAADRDRITMANARNVACMVALEQDNYAKALNLAREALDLAEQTENRRVCARALTSLGSVLLKLNNAVEADDLYQRAVAQLKPEERDEMAHDYVWSDLQRLRREIDAWIGSKDPTIVRLTAGQTRGLKLDRILERVERRVIGHVYEANGENAEATATELGIGDERVRKVVGRSRKRGPGNRPRSA